MYLLPQDADRCETLPYLRDGRPVLDARPAVPLPGLHPTVPQASQAQRCEAAQTGVYPSTSIALVQ